LQQTGHVRDNRRIDDALPHRIGNVGTNQNRPGKLTDTSQDNGISYSQGLGANRIGHGIRHVIGTDVPRHIEAQQGRKRDNHYIHFIIPGIVLEISASSI
jgi:hypothetical protein